MYVYAKYKASIPCSYWETDLSAGTEHFDHVHEHTQAHVDADKHRGYHISPFLLCKGMLKITFIEQISLRFTN